MRGHGLNHNITRRDADFQNWGVWDLRFLSEINSLDLVDREKLIAANRRRANAFCKSTRPIRRSTTGVMCVVCFSRPAFPRCRILIIRSRCAGNTWRPGQD